ncbi:MAG: 16S rRNA (cytosine(1402)-N(4))-methyltransferase RsmH [Spirochaetota bacterium]
MYTHYPVMLEEVLDCLEVAPGQVVVDCTLGEGGHAREMVRRLEGGTLIGIEQDGEVLERAKERLEAFGDRFIGVRDNFSRIREIVEEQSPTGKADRVLFDLGVSRFHLISSGRGFSFNRDEPLDMRMDRGRPLDAYQVVNTFSRHKLSEIIWAYGEERFANRIALRIEQAREKKPISTSRELADIVKGAVPRKYWPRRIHPATRTFQAVRVFVNDELDILEQSVRDAVEALAPEGRICVISFHSLEDRIVKSVFNDLRRGCTCPPDFPVCVCGGTRKLRVLTRKPVTPSESELERNPPSRSARMRCAQKLRGHEAGNLSQEVQQSA